MVSKSAGKDIRNHDFLQRTSAIIQTICPRQASKRHLAGDERVERSLSVSKTDLLPLQQSPIRGSSSRPHCVSTLYTWICNTGFPLRTRCIFRGIHPNPSTKSTLHVDVSLARDHSAHACLHRPEQIEGDVPRNRTKGGMAILTYVSDFPIHVPSTS